MRKKKQQRMTQLFVFFGAHIKYIGTMALLLKLFWIFSKNPPIFLAINVVICWIYIVNLVEYAGSDSLLVFFFADLFSILNTYSYLCMYFLSSYLSIKHLA